VVHAVRAATPAAPMTAPYRVYCVSSGRPGNVPAMNAALAPDEITWVVPHAERHDYYAAGAQALLPVPPPLHPDHYQLPVQRQAALDHAMESGCVCIQTDDDLRGFKQVVPLSGRRATTAPAAWPQVRDAMLAALDGRVHLVGLPPTDNAMFATRSKPHNGLVAACLTACDTADPACAPPPSRTPPRRPCWRAGRNTSPHTAPAPTRCSSAP
jgi:hypothetical protein